MLVVLYIAQRRAEVPVKTAWSWLLAMKTCAQLLMLTGSMYLRFTSSMLSVTIFFKTLAGAVVASQRALRR